MIWKETKLIINDSSNINEIKTFHLYGGFYRKKSKIGFYLKASIKKIYNPEKNINFIKKKIVKIKKN